jgi:hypothetical protein
LPDPAAVRIGEENPVPEFEAVKPLTVKLAALTFTSMALLAPKR